MILIVLRFKIFSLTTDQAKLNSCDLSKLDGLKLDSLVILGLQEAPKLIEQNRDFVAQQGQSRIEVGRVGFHSMIFIKFRSFQTVGITQL